MTVKVEFDGELPFPVEFAEFIVASGMPQDAVKYTPQALDEAHQAQARQNIGAMAAGIQKSLAINSTEDTAADVVLETELRESGIAALQFYSGGANVGAEHPTILGGIADGENDNDVATVGQVKEMVKQSGGGSLSAEIVDDVLVVTLSGGITASINDGVLVVA